MPRLASVPFLILAFEAQEVRSRNLLRGMPSPGNDQLPVRRLEGGGGVLNVSLPVLRKSDFHLSGYNMLSRKVTVWWKSAVPALTWEVQVQRWNRYGDDILASWGKVGTTPESTKETQMLEVFLDLQRYLYAFRVRAIGIDGTKGAFSHPTELYGELLEKNATLPQSVPALQALEFNGEPNKPEALKLGNGFPVQHRGDQAYIVLKAVEVAFDLGVHLNFSTFYTWAHKAFPILKASISKTLNNSALVQIQSGELFLGGDSCNYDGAECRARKYVDWNVSIIALSENSGVEYLTKVNHLLESIRNTDFLPMFVSELIDHDVIVPEGLTLSRRTEGSIKDTELSVDLRPGFVADGAVAAKADSKQRLYSLLGGGVVVLISGLAICFLLRKYRRLSQVARELNAQAHENNQHELVMLDLAKKASQIRHEMEDIHHARDAIQHEKDAIHHEKELAMTPAISIQGSKVIDPLRADAAIAEVLPTLLSVASAVPKK